MPKSTPPPPPKSQPKSQPTSQPKKPTTPASKTFAAPRQAKSTASAATKPKTPAKTAVRAASAQVTTSPLAASASDRPAAITASAAAVLPADPISPPDAASLADPAQQAIARAKYQALHDQISSTRETLPGNDDTNRTLLRNRAEEAQDVLTTLDRNDLQANTPAFTAAATQIQKANSDMDDLKNSIGGIIHNIQAVADFVQITNEAVSAAAKFIV